jgi:UDP-N-acetylglucosamine 1-carboxyvinyltransferase
MDKLIIEGGRKLTGEVQISGSKNAALPILFGTILTDKGCDLSNVPALADITTTLKLLSMMGIKTQFNKKDRTAFVQAADLTSLEAPYDLVRTMRASVLVLGPTLARYGEAKVSLPGGCSIGARPVNLHLSALEKMGAQIEIEEGYIKAKCRKLKGAEITFEQVSVGATENIMMAATLAEGTTILHNAALEPEIVDLAVFLRACGADIKGEGTSTIVIRGGNGRLLHGCNHSIIPDRIEAGTYLVAGAITGGNVFLRGVSSKLFEAVLEKLKASGMDVRSDANGVHLSASAAPKAVNISTVPFPGFPTDMQAQFMSLMSISDGVSAITENIFENRFMHVAELSRLGADVQIQGNVAIVNGLGQKKKHLKGATVMATDLRASACLVLAALAAEGSTQVRRVYHLDRGYEEMEVKLNKLGAKVIRDKE